MFRDKNSSLPARDFAFELLTYFSDWQNMAYLTLKIVT
jgi:hypothetical protein